LRYLLKKHWNNGDITNVAAWIVAMGLQHPDKFGLLFDANRRYCESEGLLQSHYTLAQIRARPEYRREMKRLPAF